MAEAMSTGRPVQSGETSTYRAHLDGIRAIAVYLVVAFHAGLDRAAGGYIGVDVFFVLSGYLVTEVLLRDVNEHGRIRFARFYARRFRRLLPAAFFALIATAAVYTLVFTPLRVSEAQSAFQAAFLYVTNWFFIHEGADYFGDQLTSSPVLHYWSLAVEEQFYAIWPVLLAGLIWGATKVSESRRRWVVAAAVAAGAAASLAFALASRADSPNRAYYGTDARAYQLLLGALLALLPGLIRRAGAVRRMLAPVAALSFLAMLVLASSMLDTDPVTRGAAVTVCTLTLIVCLDAGGGGPLTWFLSLRPLVYLGRISYGTYLWHWPIIVVGLELTSFGSRALVVISAVIGSALAALSSELVEMPIRGSTRLNLRRGTVVLGGLTVSVLSALVLIPGIMQPDGAGSLGTRAGAAELLNDGLTLVPKEFDQLAVRDAGYGDRHRCTAQDVTRCTIVTGTGVHVLLIGDSNAWMLTAPLTSIARDHDLTLSVWSVGGCPWPRNYNWPDPERRKRCQEPKEDLYERIIPALDPDIVVAINTMDLTRGPALEFGGTERDEEERQMTLDSAEQLTAGGRELLIVEPIARPGYDFSPLDCLVGATYVEECRFTVPVEPYWIERLERKITVGNPKVHTIDLDRVVCPLKPICDTVIDDTVVWWDAAHLTHAYQPRLIDPLTTRLRAIGILPPD